MLADYLPIILLAGLTAAFAVASLAASALLRPKAPTPAKLSPYECGIVPEGDPRGERFPVKFYVVAMLFIIFDIEIIFLFPWAITFRELGMFGLVEMAVFIGLVFVAYIYVRRKGGLDWQLAGLREDHVEAPAVVDPDPDAPPTRDREVAHAG